MAEAVEELLEILEKSKMILDMKNDIFVKKFPSGYVWRKKYENTFEKLETGVKDIEEFKSEINNEDKLYRKRLSEKSKFLKKNFDEMVRLDENVTENLKKVLEEKSHLFIGYCLAKRFQLVFNNEGLAKTNFYYDRNNIKRNFANKLKEVLGVRRVDVE
ncbi:hypothetical protein ACQ4LE_009589 [Meloidogyne hapla]|uniref:Uncharacterized protein n=1 Tax=Meloidogyne hapla TaxID=6305 RepID=A0A1I8BRU6_MELHA